jgi:hypothetical protein
MKRISTGLAATALSAGLSTSAQTAGGAMTAALLDAGAAENWVHANGN